MLCRMRGRGHRMSMGWRGMRLALFRGMRTLMLIAAGLLAAAGCHDESTGGADAAELWDGGVGDGDGGGLCPAEAFSDQACVTGTVCDYGTETCCDQTYPAIECSCYSGAWNCLYTDACLIPSCEQEVPCGDATCGVGEYCVNECLCCGIPDAGPPQSRSECMPLPEGCNPAEICSCDGIAGNGWCGAGHRTVDSPCA